MNKEIYQLIKDRIIRGLYEPSQLINEKQLIDELEVSRVPIRESLARLEWEKLVTIVPRAGAIVSPIELGLIREVYQIRIMIEGFIGRIATEKARKRHLNDLSRVIKKAREIQKKGGTREDVISIDQKFRAVLAEAAGNKTLQEMSDYLYNITIRLWHSKVGDEYFSHEWEKEIIQMEKTFTALKNKKPDEAEKARRGMISEYVEELKRTFDF